MCIRDSDITVEIFRRQLFYLSGILGMTILYVIYGLSVKNTISVSYTHLDVYKRQDPHLPPAIDYSQSSSLLPQLGYSAERQVANLLRFLQDTAKGTAGLGLLLTSDVLELLNFFFLQSSQSLSLIHIFGGFLGGVIGGIAGGWAGRTAGEAIVENVYQGD